MNCNLRETGEHPGGTIYQARPAVGVWQERGVRVCRELGILHRGFGDPPRLAAAASSEEEALGQDRRIPEEFPRLVHELAQSPGVRQKSPRSLIKEETTS